MNRFLARALGVLGLFFFVKQPSAEASAVDRRHSTPLKPTTYCYSGRNKPAHGPEYRSDKRCEKGREETLEKRVESDDDDDDDAIFLDYDALDEVNRHKASEERIVRDANRHIGERSPIHTHRDMNINLLDEDSRRGIDTSNISPLPLPPTRDEPNDIGGPTTSRIEGYVQAGRWMDRSIYTLDPLDSYPNEQEANTLLSLIDRDFFSRFRQTREQQAQNQGPMVPSDTMIYPFGRSGRYTCRLVWLNPHRLSYPQGGLVRPGIAVNPKEYSVEHQYKTRWAKGEIFYRGRPTRSEPAWKQPALPALGPYLEMRLMSRVGPGDRWPEGMGGVLESRDSMFAIGYRIWRTRDGDIPMDKAKRAVIARNEETVQRLIKELYSVRARGMWIRKKNSPPVGSR